MRSLDLLSVSCSVSARASGLHYPIGPAIISRNRKYCTATNITKVSAREDWKIFVGVALIRPPVVAPPMSAVESRFSSVANRIEEENSLLSDFELKTAKDERLLDKRAKLEAEGKEMSQLDEEIGVTAKAYHDEWLKKAEHIKKTQLLNPFINAENSFGGDASLKTTLDKKLLFIVRQSFQRGDGYLSPWILPQFENRVGETLRQTAERSLSEIFVGDFRASISGNAPVSVYSYKFQRNLLPETKDSTVRAKVFLYSASLLRKADVVLKSKEIGDYRWITMDELNKYFVLRKYRNLLSMLLYK